MCIKITNSFLSDIFPINNNVLQIIFFQHIVTFYENCKPTSQKVSVPLGQPLFHWVSFPQGFSVAIYNDVAKYKHLSSKNR
jgi:hypothetical protein